MTTHLLLCLLLLGGHRSLACPDPCSCQGGRVECSGRSLTSGSMPSSFPIGTTELRLHDNLLSTLPNGLLDDLTSLQIFKLLSKRDSEINLKFCDFFLPNF
uniref:LRRNT domain-containing protein n=1 Tax=Poecilia latipinna TaxID=48699 RepID=A0A3B3VR40_9TELE